MSPHYSDKTILIILPDKPSSMRFSMLADGNRNYLYSCVSCMNSFKKIFLGGSFPELGLFPYTHLLISAQLNSQKGSCRLLNLSVCTTHSSLILCSVSVKELASLNFQLHLLNSRDCQALPGLLFSVSWVLQEEDTETEIGLQQLY